MKDHLLSLVGELHPATYRRNIAREYLQARILAGMQRAGAMIPLAFHGGTALRFLHGIPRWSEDLDFTLEHTREAYDFRTLLSSLAAGLGREGYQIQVQVNDQKTVNSAFLRFPGLPQELGFSHRRQEILKIKIEVDTRPPAGAGLETTVVRRQAILHLQHHDRSSLLAGKLHALLQRPYLKGRDVFDLIWYLSDPGWPAPNLVMLNNALRQSGHAGSDLTLSTWRGTVRERVSALDWAKVRADVSPFIEASFDIDLLTREVLLSLLH